MQCILHNFLYIYTHTFIQLNYLNMKFILYFLQSCHWIQGEVFTEMLNIAAGGGRGIIKWNHEVAGSKEGTSSRKTIKSWNSLLQDVRDVRSSKSNWAWSWKKNPCRDVQHKHLWFRNSLRCKFASCGSVLGSSLPCPHAVIRRFLLAALGDSVLDWTGNAAVLTQHGHLCLTVISFNVGFFSQSSINHKQQSLQ